MTEIKMTEFINETVFEINKMSLFAEPESPEEKECEPDYLTTLRQKFDEITPFTRGWINSSRTKFGKHFDTRFRGPHSNCNWVIPGALMVGDYPEHDCQMRAIQSAGITTFGCLNVEYGTPDLKRRYNYPRYGDKLPAGHFHHFPIVDMNITKDEPGLVQFCKTLTECLLRGEKLYVHCSGGHGRTGTVIGIMLKMLFADLTIDQIFDHIQCAHDQRVSHNYGNYSDWAKFIVEKELHDKFAPGQVPSPQLSIQRNQVIKVISEL